MVKAINKAVSQGLPQKRACNILGLEPRKFRRWANPKPLRPRTAWNKILPEERNAILETAYEEPFWGKPVSHVFVHGHNSHKFYASLSTVHKVLKSENMVHKQPKRKRNGGYVSAHSLMNQGFSLLCYDATRFVPDSGIPVWAIPVMILPHRYILRIGYSLRGVSAADLTRVVTEALAILPETLADKLLAHSDRGSAMKASSTKKIIKELLGAPIHYGRPHTPDDQAWIEALIKTLKYHREAPVSFNTVDDVAQWLKCFSEIYNNDPHSSLEYVTPLQALSGTKEVILNQRKQNLVEARKIRYNNWKNKQRATTALVPSEVVTLAV